MCTLGARGPVQWRSPGGTDRRSERVKRLEKEGERKDRWGNKGRGKGGREEGGRRSRGETGRRGDKKTKRSKGGGGRERRRWGSEKLENRILECSRTDK